MNLVNGQMYEVLEMFPGGGWTVEAVYLGFEGGSHVFSGLYEEGEEMYDIRIAPEEVESRVREL